MKPQLVTVHFSADALKAIYTFNDKVKVYTDSEREWVIRNAGGICELIEQNSVANRFYLDAIEWYDGGVNEENMQGWHHAEWIRAMRRARA